MNGNRKWIQIDRYNTYTSYMKTASSLILKNSKHTRTTTRLLFHCTTTTIITTSTTATATTTISSTTVTTTTTNTATTVLHSIHGKRNRLPVRPRQIDQISAWMCM